MVKRKRIGDLLADAGLITPKQLEEALELQRGSNLRLGDVLISQGYITEQQLIEVLEFQLGVPHIRLSQHQTPPQVLQLIPGKTAKQHHVFPVKTSANKLIVAMSDPLDYYAMNDIHMITGMRVEPVIASKDDIAYAIRRFYGMHESVEKIIQNLDIPVTANKTERVEEEDQSPVVNAVNQMIIQAVQVGASDIHLDPQESGTRLRYRVDGLMRTELTLPIHMHKVIVARIKIMGDMDVAERRLPQDGRINMAFGEHKIDIRISTLPTIFGEKVVMRVLDLGKSMTHLHDLDMSAQNLAIFRKAIHSSFGAVLITGPTGSGKSTTLYAALSELNAEQVNMITIEDPVEYQIEGVNQVQVNTAAGLTFANGLRSILRQDPNVVMVGEIRDVETAEIAIRAAMTGHLVLSTLHTNNAVNAITRLMDMGVEPFLVSSAVSCVVAQRLVRKICPHCRMKLRMKGEDTVILLKQHGFDPDAELYVGAGCAECNHSGYQGRLAVHEVLAVDDELRALIMQKRQDSVYYDHVLKQGMVPMMKDGLSKALQGLTTVEEVYRAAGQI